MMRAAGGVLSVAMKRVRSLRAHWLFVALITGFASRGMAQCDYQVTSLSDSGAGTLRAGLATAPTTTDICFSVQGTITLQSPLQITAPITITGSNGVTISGNNSVGIFVIDIFSESSSPVVTISGLTLSGGNATVGNNIYGGALWVQAGPTTLTNMTITGNTAESGGAIYAQDSVTIQNSTISNNTASTGSGGGINNSYGTLTIQNTTISGNTSTGGSGGALDNYGTALITGGTIQGNSASYGGAIDNEYNDSSTSILTISGGTAFNSNIATLNGGAIENYGTANITAALFNANQAQGNSDLVGCGGAICNESTLTVTESTFVANTTTGSGGGIESDSGTSITLQDDTISGNTAGYTGSGLDLEQSSSAPVVENTVIAGNTAIQGQTNPDCFGCAATTPAGDFIGGTANLGPLTNNGGPTLTMMPLPAGNLVGLGVPADTTDTSDQRGFSRLSSGVIDIGAVQSHYNSVSYSTQPSNTLINQTITPAVAVQVVENDQGVANFPQGVPVTLSLIPPQGVNATLGGTLTQLPTVVNGVTAALFPDLSVNAVGGFQLLATDAILGNSGSADPAYNATSTTFQIAPVVKLQWTPAPATYGPLPASELNATATVNGAAGTGTFLYTFVPSGATINVGQIYPVNSYRVQVAFTPTGSSTTYTLQTTLQITQATPVSSWATPAPIYPSTALSATQLDATATGVTGAALPGTFVYTPAAGTKLTAGPHTLSTTFTPTDATDYTTATHQVTIQVNAVTASTAVIQTSANPITFGQSETFTAVVTGSDGNPFSGGTAAFAVDGASIGSAAVVNGSASVTDTSLTGGTHQVVLTYSNATQTLTNTITLTVNKASPALAWATPAPIFTSTALSATQLDATATGVTGAALPGAFVYIPAAGTKLTAGPHTLSTTFTPTDATDYTTATHQVTIQVNAVTASTAVIQTSANPITFGQSETFTAVVTGSDGNPFSGGTAAFAVDGASIGSAAVVNGSASVTDATLKGGTHQVVLTYTNATQTLTGNTTITVNKASPTLTWATPAPIYTSTALSATQLDATATGVTGAALPGAFVYAPAAGTKLTAGPHTLNTTFTPTDATDYTTATDQVTIQVNAVTASTAVIQTSANPITFGQSETFTAVITGSDGNPFSGGTAAFAVDGASIGSAAVVNGSASVTDATLKGGTHQVVLTYSNATQTLTNTITLTVNKASPALAWATPTPIYTSASLSATQLDATATGVTGAALPGTFVYTPAAGTKLTAGPHTLSTTFTPTDITDYTTATHQVTIQVNAVTASTAVIQTSANPITFGQSETFTAVVTGSDGNPFSGGTAAFAVDGASIGSAAVVNGSASVTDATLKGGSHQVVLTYTNATQTLTGNATLTVNKASPVLEWATPAAIYTSTALSATQLDATATGVTGTSLPGTTVYNPPAGTFLTNGAHVLSVAFTPTDTVDYTTATTQATISVNYTPLSISAITPATVTLSTAATIVAITGSGFTATTVAELNGTPLPTTVSSATGLSATIAPSALTAVGAFNLTVYDPTSKLTSNALTLTVTAPTVDLTVTPPQEPTSGQQPVIGLVLNTPYPTALAGTMTLSFTPSGNIGVDDPAVQFATGGRTLTFTVPAGSTTTPQVALQTGTVAGTINVTLSLLADSVDVTPAGISPITLEIKPAVPVITSVTFSNNSTGQLTVVINGYSNTRDMSGADFDFIGTGATSLGSATASVSVSSDFTPWYTSTTSDQYGSEFSYSQSFQLSRPDSGITGVSVTLTNSIGTSESVSSQ